MTNKELQELLAQYPDEMEVRVENQKQCYGTMDIQFLVELKPQELETNWENLSNNALVIRVR